MPYSQPHGTLIGQMVTRMCCAIAHLICATDGGIPLLIDTHMNKAGMFYDVGQWAILLPDITINMSRLLTIQL